MSRKSRPPKGGGARGKKGRKGKKGSSTTYEEVIVEESGGLPFGLVVLIALVMTLPTLTAFFDGSLEFRPTVVRLLAALLVSWLLCQLVYSVVKSFGADEEETVRTTETTEDLGYGEDPYGQDRRAS
ncbi:hypothetical protein [Mobilicoccus caccae]|uniref:Uncharacterized protein n=1 Tax=Mobilicoccus caccae TaxID=1859295 RepID=A0ABQ6IWG4_9MICO|nr:hypothetical protein [Mobilicoccus caccae]GMA41039.1 hypothetical protein GCM10025883_30840 [Mobilicoccus caccae]